MCEAAPLPGAPLAGGSEAAGSRSIPKAAPCYRPTWISFPDNPKALTRGYSPLLQRQKSVAIGVNHAENPGWWFGSQPHYRGTVVGSLQSLLHAGWSADFCSIRDPPASGFPNNPSALLRNKKQKTAFKVLKYLNNVVENEINYKGCYSLANTARQRTAWQTTKQFPEKTQIWN